MNKNKLWFQAKSSTDDRPTKDSRLWFRAKMYGYGWYPVSWEGWAVLALYITTIVVHLRNTGLYSHSTGDVFMSFTLPFIINTIFLLIICYCRGEKPRWRWDSK